MRKTETHFFFWDTIYSQWLTRPGLIVEDGISYNSAEQYMMVKKAEVFGATDIKEQMMSSVNPGNIKALGRKIPNFSDEEWDKHKINVVAQGSYLKFSQNQDLLDEMLSHRDLILVEASPYDRVWGIGLAPDNDDVLDLSKWNGQNLLGVCLTIARDKIIQERNL